MTIILGIKLTEKIKNAVGFQKILTKFNCVIKMRIGINNSSFFCSQNGIILLQIENSEDAFNLERALLNIEEIELQKMIF